jgi:hypothetical protein
MIRDHPAVGPHQRLEARAQPPHVTGEEEHDRPVRTARRQPVEGPADAGHRGLGIDEVDPAAVGDGQAVEDLVGVAGVVPCRSQVSTSAGVVVNPDDDGPQPVPGAGGGPWWWRDGRGGRHEQRRRGRHIGGHVSSDCSNRGRRGGRGRAGTAASQERDQHDGADP